MHLTGRTRRALSVVAALAVALAVGLVVVPRRAEAIPPTLSELTLLLRLNGTPTKLGVLASAAGASISNAATATPFTVTAGTPLLIQCDVTAHITLSGGTASRTITASTYGPKIETPQLFYAVPSSTAISMIPAAVVAGNCAVWTLNF